MGIVTSEREESYVPTSPDTGEPVSAFMEPFIFPKYSTDEVRIESLLQMAADIAEAVVSQHTNDHPWDDTFNDVLQQVDNDLVGNDDFIDVRRYIWKQLPPQIQIEIQY